MTPYICSLNTLIPYLDGYTRLKDQVYSYTFEHKFRKFNKNHRRYTYQFKTYIYNFHFSSNKSTKPIQMETS